MVKDERICDEMNRHEKSTSPLRPLYQKPKTSLFFETTTINGGAGEILESNGGGYLSS